MVLIRLNRFKACSIRKKSPLKLGHGERVSINGCNLMKSSIEPPSHQSSMKKELAILFAIFGLLVSTHAGESVVSIEGGATLTPNAEIKELYGLALKSLGGNAEVEFNEGYNLSVNYVYYPENLTSSQWVGFGLDYLFYFHTLKDVTVNGHLFLSLQTMSG